MIDLGPGADALARSCGEWLMRLRVTMLIGSVVLGGIVKAAEPVADSSSMRITGELAASAWTFRDPGQLSGQADGLFFPMLEGQMRFDYSWNNEHDRLTLQPYGRWDIRTDRDLIDLQDAYYLHTDEQWDGLLGVQTVFWGVTEARHLVNIINQVDGLGDVDEEDRLGQPMVNVNLFSPRFGNLGLYSLLGFREREFPSAEDRLRTPMIVAEDKAQFEEDGFARHSALAMRYSNVLALDDVSMDVAVSYFYGTGREPRLVPSGQMLVPFYDMIHQVGIEGLAVWNDWQFKYEGIWRTQADEEFSAGVAGVEYTIPGFFNTSADIGILGEYLFDDRSQAMPPTLFDRDVFAGLRVSVNNENNSYLLAGVVMDTQDSEKVFRLEYSQRLMDELLLEIEGRAFIGFDEDELGYDPNQDSFILTRLRTFF